MDLNTATDIRPAQIAGMQRGGHTLPMLRLTLPDALEIVDLHEDSTRSTFYGLNDAGTMCGYISFDVSTHRKKSDIVSYPFRYGDSLELLPQAPSGGDAAYDINSAGDIINAYDVYHDTWGHVSPDDVVTGDATIGARWFAGRFEIALLGDRNESDFGLLVGTLFESDGRAGFVLVPVPVE